MLGNGEFVVSATLVTVVYNRVQKLYFFKNGSGCERCWSSETAPQMLILTGVLPLRRAAESVSNAYTSVWEGSQGLRSVVYTHTDAHIHNTYVYIGNWVQSRCDLLKVQIYTKWEPGFRPPDSHSLVLFSLLGI